MGVDAKLGTHEVVGLIDDNGAAELLSLRLSEVF